MFRIGEMPFLYGFYVKKVSTMKANKNYKFTNKAHGKWGIMSTILGLISIGSFFLAIYDSYQIKGEAGANYGLVGVWIFLFASVGLGLGLWTRTDQDGYHLFPYLGIVLNLVALFMVSFILYAGAYGL